MADKPKITHVCEVEGDIWVPWAEWRSRPVRDPSGKRIHAWRLSDGTVWDAYGGLRPVRMWDKPIDGAGWAEAAFAADYVKTQLGYIEDQGLPPTVVNDASRQNLTSIKNWLRDA